MIRPEDDLEEQEESRKNTIDRRKILIFLLPVLIVIGVGSGIFYFFLRADDTSTPDYVMLPAEGGAKETAVVFYDLPEIAVLLQNEQNSSLRIKMNIELGSVEDIATIEALLPRINDMIISHTLALRPEEINGSRGMYWLKEEFLQRLNLLAAPVKIKNLNFKNFEFVKDNQ